MDTLSTKKSGGKIPFPLSSFTLFQRDFILTAVKAGSSRSEAHGCSSEAWKKVSVEEKKYWKEQELIEKEIHSLKYPGWKRAPRAKNKKASGVSDPSGNTTDKEPGDTINKEPGDAAAEAEWMEPEMKMDIGVLTEDGQLLTAADLFSESQIQDTKRYVMNLLGYPTAIPPETTNATVCEQSANTVTVIKPPIDVVVIEASPVVSRSEHQDSEDQLVAENEGSAAPNDSSDVEEAPDFEQLYFLDFYRKEIEPQCTPQSNGKGITIVKDRKLAKATATVEEHAESESQFVSYRSSGKGRKLSTPGALPEPCVDIPKKRNRSFSEADIHRPTVRARIARGLGVARVLGTT